MVPSVNKDAILLLLRYAEPARNPFRHVMRCSPISEKRCITSAQQSSQFSARLLLAKHNHEKLVQVPHSRISTIVKSVTNCLSNLATQNRGDVPTLEAE